MRPLPKSMVILGLGIGGAAAFAACATRGYNQSGTVSKKEKKADEPELPLAIDQLIPSDGSTDVPLDVSIKVRLTTPVASFKNSSLVVENVSGGTADKEGPLGYFKPRAPLNPNTQYRVKLLKGLQSKGGQQLDHDVTWSFRTGERMVKEGPALASLEGLKDGDGIKIFRIQGGVGKNRSRERFKLDEKGGVKLSESEGMLFFNMGDEARAVWWLKNRGTKSYAFKIEVTKEFGQFIRFSSLLQKLGAGKEKVPQIVDFNQARDQYGLPPEMFVGLIASIIPGTPRILQEDDFRIPALVPENMPRSNDAGAESENQEAGHVD